MRNLSFAPWLSILLLLFCWGCGSQGKVAEKTYSAKCWPMQDTLSGTFEVTSADDRFVLFFPVTATDDYPYYNLFVKGELISPSGESAGPEPLEFRLLTPEGDWANDCKGKECEFNLEWITDRSFSETGTYTIKLLHFMRDPSLCGVSEVGIGVKKID